jgi:hypothetical protein
VTTIADIVAAEPDPSEAMKRYVGYTLRIGEMRLEILGISSPFDSSDLPDTHLPNHEEHGLRLTDLPIFLCSENPNHDDPSHDDIIPFLGKGKGPPEICCLASPM